MTSDTIQALLKDHETELMRDRRSACRKPFVRPIQIAAGRHRDELHDAFSRDISHIGIGTISRIEWPMNAVARLTIYALNNRQISIDAQARWTEPFGQDWFVTGWIFLDR